MYADARNTVDDVLEPTIQALRTHPTPVIAAVDGVANGGGCELVLLIDLTVASTGSDFAFPETRIGALPPIGLTYGQASLRKKAIMELSLTGSQVTASEAESMGIINHEVIEGEVDDVLGAGRGRRDERAVDVRRGRPAQRLVRRRAGSARRTDAVRGSELRVRGLP